MSRQLQSEPEAIAPLSDVDRALVAACYEQHYASLIRVAYLLCDSSAAAQDAVHEVFLRCARRLETLDHPASYLRTSVVNECRAQHRRSSREREVNVDAGRAKPEDDWLPHEELETRRALSVLTDRQREAVVLRYFVDLPDSEIAETLRCEPSTVRSLLHRALKQLEEELR